MTRYVCCVLLLSLFVGCASVPLAPLRMQGVVDVDGQSFIFIQIQHAHKEARTLMLIPEGGVGFEVSGMNFRDRWVLIELCLVGFDPAYSKAAICDQASFDGDAWTFGNKFLLTKDNVTRNVEILNLAVKKIQAGRYKPLQL